MKGNKNLRSAAESLGSQLSIYNQWFLRIPDGKDMAAWVGFLFVHVGFFGLVCLHSEVEDDSIVVAPHSVQNTIQNCSSF